VLGADVKLTFRRTNVISFLRGLGRSDLNNPRIKRNSELVDMSCAALAYLSSVSVDPDYNPGKSSPSKGPPDKRLGHPLRLHHTCRSIVDGRLGSWLSRLKHPVPWVEPVRYNV